VVGNDWGAWLGAGSGTGERDSVGDPLSLALSSGSATKIKICDLTFTRNSYMIGHCSYFTFCFIRCGKARKERVPAAAWPRAPRRDLPWHETRRRHAL
jgi:hypothetical protein